MAAPPIRQWLILSLILVQGLILMGLTLVLRGNMKTLQLENARQVMQHVSENVLEKTKSYLAPAEQTARETSQMLTHQLFSPESNSFETYLLEQLVNNPQLTGVYFGAQTGAFVYAKRSQQGYSLKRIAVSSTGRVVRFKDFDRQLRLLGQHRDDTDRFDPRTRPWYQQALQRKTLAWTGPYVFFTSQKPGITTAIQTLSSAGAVVGVVGVDIEITVLSDFIEHVPTSPHGASFITTSDGVVVGMPDLSTKLPPGSSSLPQLSQVATPAALALLGLGLHDQAFRVFQVNGESWVGMVRPLLVNQDASWWLGIHAPQSDFVGSTENLFNRQLIQAVTISGLTLLLALPLLWHISTPIETWYKRATTDEVTALLNRSEFMRRAAQELRVQEGTSIAIMLDLDRFKNVNDAFGHQAGDQVLRTVAERLRASVRQKDLVARFGGDEFALLLPGMTGQTALERFETWRQQIVEPFQDMLSVSAGLIELSPKDSLEEGLHKADLALLQAKSRGKNQTVQAS